MLCLSTLYASPIPIVAPNRKARLLNYRSFGTNLSSYSVKGMWSYVADNTSNTITRYANDLTQDQKNALLDVVKVTSHARISPEIRRELIQSVARGEPVPQEDVEMAS